MLKPVRVLGYLTCLASLSTPTNKKSIWFLRAPQNIALWCFNEE